MLSVPSCCSQGATYPITHASPARKGGGGSLVGGGGEGGSVSVHRSFGEQSGATTGRQAFLKASEHNRTRLHCGVNQKADYLGTVLHSWGGKHTFAQGLIIKCVFVDGIF